MANEVIWGQYTPPIQGSDAESEMWALVHSKKKYVFSKTQKGDGSDAIFINDNLFEAVDRLKHKPGKDIWLYGGAGITTTLINLGLVDEFRLSVHPVVVQLIYHLAD